MRKLIGVLGDSQPLEYGGMLIYAVKADHRWEFEVIDPDLEEGIVTIYQFEPERRKDILVDRTLYRVPFGYKEDYPYHPSRYEEWFDESLPKVCETSGVRLSEAREWELSDNPFAVARFYQMLGEYHGFFEFDEYPIKVTPGRARKRYSRLFSVARERGIEVWL